MRRVLLIGLICSVAVAGLWAAPLNKSRVSQQANWVLHADHEQFAASTIGKLIREEVRNSPIEPKLQSFAQIFSFHPIDDVRNVTLYGQGKDPTRAVAMIQGRYNQETLTALVNMNPDYQALEYGTYKIHSWIDEKNRAQGQRQYGTFYGPDMVVISMGLESLQHGLDVLDGKAGNIAGRQDLADFERDHEGTFLLIAARDVNESVGGVDESGVAQHTRRFALAMGEEDASTYVDITLEALSAEAATKVAQILVGLKAFVSLSAADKAPSLTQLAEAITIAWQEETVRVHLAWDSQELFHLLKELAEAHEQQAAEAGSATL